MVDRIGFESVQYLAMPCYTSAARTIRECYWITEDFNLKSTIDLLKIGLMSYRRNIHNKYCDDFEL